MLGHNHKYIFNVPFQLFFIVHFFCIIIIICLHIVIQYQVFLSNTNDLNTFLFIAYIYIYIYTNLISTSILGTRKKTHQEQEIKSISNHCPGEKEKIIDKKKEKANLIRPLEKKSRDTQSGGQKKTKNLPRILQCYNYKSAQQKWSQL